MNPGWSSGTGGEWVRQYIEYMVEYRGSVRGRIRIDGSGEGGKCNLTLMNHYDGLRDSLMGSESNLNVRRRYSPLLVRARFII